MMLKRFIAIVFLVVLAFTELAGTGFTADTRSSGNLEFLCAPAMRNPIEEMLAKFKKDTGIRSQVSYGGSAILLSQLKLNSHGDIFVPADRFYTDEAVKAGFAGEPRIFAYLVPVIMVQKGNKFKVHKLTDLMNPDIRVGLVDARTAAIGKVSAAVLKKNHINVDKMNVVYKATVVDELANAIKLKSVDAVIIWKPVAILYTKDGDIINIPNDKNIVAPVSACIVKTSTNKVIARKFMNYIMSKAGKAILAKYHYPASDPGKKK